MPRASELAMVRLMEAMEKLGVAKWDISSTGDSRFSAAGYPTEAPILVAPPGILQEIVTVHNEVPTLVLEVERGVRWREIALQLAALMYVKRGPNESFCNVCGMVNMHMPTCQLQPFLVLIRDVVMEESRELRV